MEHTLEQTMTPESLKITLAAFEEEMKLEASGTQIPIESVSWSWKNIRRMGLLSAGVGFSFLHDKDRKPKQYLL